MENLTKEEIVSLIDKEPNNGEHYQEMGKYFLRNKELTEAEHYLKKSLELNCNDVWSFLYMGNLFNQKEQYLDAIAYFEQGIEVKPDEPTSYWCIAEMYEKLDKLEEANTFFEKAAAVAPEDKEVIKKFQEWKEWYLD